MTYVPDRLAREAAERLGHSRPERSSPAGQVVYVCSNYRCAAVWDADPHAHCPACRQPNGGGSSTMMRVVKSLPAKNDTEENQGS